jgi:diacylglycerol kinase
MRSRQDGGNGVDLDASSKESAMNLAILLLILALVLGGVGLFVEALRWVLIIAVILLVVGLVTGRKGRV